MSGHDGDRRFKVCATSAGRIVCRGCTSSKAILNFPAIQFDAAAERDLRTTKQTNVAEKRNEVLVAFGLSVEVSC